MTDELDAGTGASPSWTRKGAIVGVVVAALAVPVCARAAIDGRAALEAAELARTEGDPEREIEHLGRAARWSMPVSRHDERARARLRELAIEAAEASPGEPSAEALAAWRELRRASLATRGWTGVQGVQDPEGLAEANAGILAQLEAQAEADPHAPDFDRARAQAELAADPLGPAIGWVHLSGLAFVGWMVACVGLVTRAWGPDGRIDRGPALRWALFAIFCGASWLLTA